MDTRVLMCMVVIAVLLNQAAQGNACDVCGIRRCPPGTRCRRYGSAFRCSGYQAMGRLAPVGTGNKGGAGV
ncbi:hypothetical protein DPMN_057461 [Dreissena polymorpha]|uniref:Secreted protein n=1 Tax=Dreissena polymorpha TaxID=45954 RepID=A0A9D4C008_DREPO|nr:hypothetical protein DPMN_057461 [Dreissena polymorpha]